jgi:hypothetical protein
MAISVSLIILSPNQNAPTPKIGQHEVSDESSKIARVEKWYGRALAQYARPT